MLEHTLANPSKDISECFSLAKYNSDKLSEFDYKFLSSTAFIERTFKQNLVTPRFRWLRNDETIDQEIYFELFACHLYFRALFQFPVLSRT